MSNAVKDYLSGSIDKPKIDKTVFDFAHEWFNSILTVRKLLLLLLALLATTYTFNFLGVQLYLPAYLQIPAGVLIFPLVGVAVVIFIVRTISLIFTLLIPSIQATGFSLENGTLTFTKLDSNKDSYELNTVQDILLTYNDRGLLIRTVNGTFTYNLPLEPKEIESKLDVLSDFHKEVTSFMSQEGDIRTVRYNKL